MNPNSPLFDHASIAAYYAADHSLSDCQAYFGCSYRTAKRAILKQGKLRSIQEGVRLKDSRRHRTHSLEARQNIARAAFAREASKVKKTSYRVERSKQTHPVLGLSEKAWFKWLIAQADFTCSVTGVKGCQLSVHHLYSINGYPQHRWDQSNVLVIKKTLHDTFHQRFMGNARKPCTPADWERFLAS